MMSERQAFENRELLELQTISANEPMPPTADLVPNAQDSIQPSLNAIGG
jgi:hypothetical protein